MSKKQNQQLGIDEVDEETGEVLPKRKRLMIVSTITYVENAPENYEHPKGVSLTVPDMAMSIQQIMERYVTGNPIDNQETAYFDDEFPDLRMLSKTDLLEMQMGIQDEMDRLTEVINQKYALEKAEAEQAEAEKKSQAEKVEPEKTPV